ncbi:MAG TPA: serine proteinase inhibitor [Firmicutes bacterium]|nr:serine proteinase inhibitor [Bacillota bacterium]
MGKSKHAFIVTTLLLVSMALAGCSAVLPPRGDDYTDLTTLVKGVSWPEAPDSIDNKLQKALFDFSWDLFQEAAKNEGNVFISPASVYLALSMTYNGAAGETLQVMKQVLKADSFTENEFNKANRDYISILQTLGDKTELSVANSIWYREGFKPDLEFLQKNADFYDAAARDLDFDSAAAPNAINKWVREATRDTIDKIVDNIGKDVVMYLINAVYFKSVWQNPFDPANTYADGFNTPKGAVTVDFMHRTGNMNYFEMDGSRGVILPYDDGRFNFFAVLPGAGTDVHSFIKSLDGETIFAYLLHVRQDNIKLALPKFETRYEDSIKDELIALGMETAFDPYSADFSRMNEGREKNLYISEVKHKTFCKVDEEGTEASAVTSVEMPSAPPEPANSIIFDRPFVYGIVDTVTNAPLFLGIMENPAE